MCKVNFDVTCVKYIWINTVGIMTASKSQKRNRLVSCKILSKYIYIYINSCIRARNSLRR